jgi:amino acid transporter
LGPWQATALNVTCIVGAGVFVTIPPLLGKLPGPYALLAWLAAGALILVDGLIWSELGATFPGSGGSYQYLLQCYGREKWGRLASFLFIWQFLLSGPMELGSGLVAVAQFSSSLTPEFKQFNKDWTWRWVIVKDQEQPPTADQEPGQEPGLAVSFGPARLLGFLLGLGVIVLLYRNVTTLGRLTIAVWLGVMATIVWILAEGWARFSPATAFDFSGAAATWPEDFGWKLGPAMILSMYAYLGYYTVCYVGEEVRDPGRTLPRAILGSALIVCVLFAGLHLAMLGTVPWSKVPTNDDNYSLPAEFMGQIHGPWAVTLVTLLLIWCCFGSVFAGMLGYSRIPYGAARNGHFFRVFATIHPRERIPHVALALVGGLTLFWSFFDLQNVINALIVTRILEQFVAQAIGIMLLRRYQPDRPRPFRMWFYPLPCLLALAGWLYLYGSAEWLYIALGGGTLLTGIVVFLIWSRQSGNWPFASAEACGSNRGR